MSLVGHARSRFGYLALALIAAAALAIGSYHPATPTRAERISTLEAQIKCPSCADLTIGESEAAAAIDLRHQVVALVDAGRSNAEIRATVVREYGTAVLEVPDGGGIGVLVWALPSAAVVLLAGGLTLVLVRRRRATAALRAGVAAEADEALVAAARGQWPGPS